MHTTWSDGSASPREMIEHAITLGLERIAITDHSYLYLDEGYCLPADTAGYVAELRSLAAEYTGRIEVLCGIEQDFYSPSIFHDEEEMNAASIRRDDFDWVVGSVHYVRFKDELVSIDDTPEIFEHAAQEFCNGDYLALAESYFETVSKVVERTGATIIGHFDLVKKFNGNGDYFDEADPRYRSSWMKAADALIATGVSFEVNTGGMFRGWRSDPYPSWEIQDYLIARGAILLHSSDAHSPDAIRFNGRHMLWRE